MTADANRTNFGSGVVVGLGLIGLAMIVLAFVRVVGWDATWRAFGVTPLHPPFFDMHVINDYAACAAKGIDPYNPHSCSGVNFNIPPTWLWLGRFGIETSHSAWMSLILVSAAAAVMVMLFRGRSWSTGLLALAAIASPSVMMGVERGNLDLLVLAVVGASALIYDERRFCRAFAALGILSLGIALKLVPIFCVSLIARFSKRALIASCILFAIGCTYLIATLPFIILIRRNVPTTFILSYGYKAIFLGMDHMRGEAGLVLWWSAHTWLPLLTAALVLSCAVVVAARNISNQHPFCIVDASSAGTAFLFGAGIYCGTYLLGTNFIYRLMFLLLCVPQLLDWLLRNCDTTSWRRAAGLLATILGVLWVNGNPNGHSSFLLYPQVLNWILFFFLSSVLILNFLHQVRLYKSAQHVAAPRASSTA